MTLRRGTALTAVLTVAAAAGALAIAGFTTFSGKSLCSLMSCDGAKSAGVTTQAASHECPFHDQVAAEKKSCATSCSSKMACGEKSESSAFVTMNAAFPVAIPAAFNDGKGVCPSTLVKAAHGSCSKSVSSCGSSAQTMAASNETKASGCCSKAKAQTMAASNEAKSSCASACSKTQAAAESQTIAACNEAKTAASGGCKEKAQAETIKASNEAKSGCCKEKAQAQAIEASNETKSASGCCPLGGLKSQTVAASNEAKADCKSACSSAKACNPANCDPAECIAKGCDPAQCAGPCDKGAFVTMNASFPVAIPAAFNDQKQVCPTTLVKAAGSCSSSCSKKVSDAGCCKGSGVRADGKACCGKCTETAASEQTTDKTEG